MYEQNKMFKEDVIVLKSLEIDKLAEEVNAILGFNEYELSA